MSRSFPASVSLTGDFSDEGRSDEGPAAAAPSCSCCGGQGAADITPGRYKLWELDPGCHCSIIGTCLSLDDLRRIIRKADLTIAADARDYDVHGFFVTRSSSRSPLSKLVHKTLDRKYAPQLARFRRSCPADELWGLWRQAMTNGDVAGAYWALMTHKAAPRAMRISAHNEVHMLSHLMGKSSRDDIKRLRQLETACAALKEQLTKASARASAALQERDVRIRALEARLAATQSVQSARQGAVDVCKELRQKEAQLDRLGARFASVERRLKVERARARAAEDKLSEIIRAQKGTPPCEVASAPEGSPSSEEPAMVGSAAGDLQGCALLYVGGYRDVTPRLRTHVEEMGGTFLYHDGGIEMQNVRLSGMVSQADAVFCPVGCISHDACLRLKNLCKRSGKRLVLLRSAGLSGFVSALSETIRGLSSGQLASGVVPPSPLTMGAEIGHG